MATIASLKNMDVHKKQNFVVSVYTSAEWVKPAETIFSTPTLLMGGAAGRRRLNNLRLLWGFIQESFSDFQLKSGVDDNFLKNLRLSVAEVSVARQPA